MSLIYEILIVLDENNKINLNEISKIISTRSKQIISSTLGRLVAKGWVEKQKKNKNFVYSLNSQAHQQLDNLLDNIGQLQEAKKTRSWLLVVFDIPEKKRKLRDDFRKFLVEEGFGRLHSSIFLSYWDKSKKIKDYIICHNIQNNTTYFYTSDLTLQEEKNLVDKLQWNWKKINKTYKTFINLGDSFLKMKTKKTFMSKSLVLNFSIILKEDPKLPKTLLPKHALTQKALKSYRKIRKYCYQ